MPFSGKRTYNKYYISNRKPIKSNSLYYITNNYKNYSGIIKFLPIRRASMKKLLVIVLATFSLQIYADAASDAVDYRQSVFTLFKANLSDMGAMMQGKKPYDAKVFNKRAMNLKALSGMPWEYFEVEGTDMVDGTKAKDAIWENPAEFKKQYTAFKKLASNLDKVAKPKATQNDVKMAFGEFAKTCKACHKKYKNK